MLQTKPYKLLYASFRLIFGFFIFYQLLISIHIFTVNGETPCKFCTSKQKKIEYDLAHQPTSVEKNIIKQESEIFVSPEGSEERYRYSYRILWGLNIKSRGVVLYIQINNHCVQVLSSYFIGLQLQINLTFVKLLSVFISVFKTNFVQIKGNSTNSSKTRPGNQILWRTFVLSSSQHYWLRFSFEYKQNSGSSQEKITLMVKKNL